jgi:hypothetical protein
MLKSNRTLNLLLFSLLIFVVLDVARPYFAPTKVKAEAETRDLYIEPGVVMLRAPDGNRQVLGKVVVDLRTGNVWGYPTLSADPYPSSGTNTTPQTSHPFLLGKFALEDMDR